MINKRNILNNLRLKHRRLCAYRVNAFRTTVLYFMGKKLGYTGSTFSSFQIKSDLEFKGYLSPWLNTMSVLKKGKL